MTNNQRRRGVGDARNRSKKKPSSAQLAARPDDIVLVPIDPSEPETYVVLGEHWPAQFGDLQAVTHLSPEVHADLTERISQGTGLANIGLQGLNGFQSVQGLVKLGPETLAAIRAGAQPLVSGGYNLGALSQGGKIVAQVRWLPATGASVAGVLAALGPAIAVAAIQFQMAAMDRKLNRIIGITSELLLSARVEKWAEVQAHFERLQQLESEAERLGRFTDEISREAHGAFAPLAANHKRLATDVSRHRVSLGACTTAKERREWFAKNGQAAYQDAQCLLLAAYGCYFYDAMRAEYLRSKDLDHALLVYQDSQKAAAKASAETGGLLAALDRSLQLLVESPGSGRLRFLGRDRAPNEVRASARELSEALAALGFAIPQPRISQKLQHRTLSGSKDVTPAPIDTLALHLTSDDELIGVWRGTKRFLCITEKALFASSIDRPAEVRWRLTWDEVESIGAFEDFLDWNVVVKPRGGKDERIETKDETAAYSWAHDLEGLRQAALARRGGAESLLPQ